MSHGIEKTQQPPLAHLDLLTRIARLEQQWEVEQRRQSGMRQTADQLGDQTSSFGAQMPDHARPDILSSDAGALVNQILPIEVPTWDTSQGDEPEPASHDLPTTDLPNIADQQPQHSQASTRCSFYDRERIPICCTQDLRLSLNHEVDDGVGAVRMVLQRYFELLNPHYPCLNESQTLAQFEEYVGATDAYQPSVDTVRFGALVHLIIALLAVLQESCPDSDAIPGWAHHEKGSHLLTHAGLLAEGNMVTIQALMIKATYLLYAEKYNASYEAVGQAVRVSYLIGLHNQGDRDEDFSPFEIHMRQRVFWSLYILERNISLVVGVPYLIRDLETRVQVPSAVDDRVIGRTEQLPEESPLSSCIPYLYCTIKWARLSSEIWDHTFCANATRPVDEEFIVIMDARIENLRDRLPPHLQWKNRSKSDDKEGDVPGFASRQARILHLRCNHLRLQLRREDLLSSDFRSRDLVTCLEIAQDTVDTIHDFWFSSTSENLQRYSCVVYVTGALIALTGILLQQKSDEGSLWKASKSFRRALHVLHDIAPSLRLARFNLKKMERVIAAAERICQSVDATQSAIEVPLMPGEGTVNRKLLNDAVPSTSMDIMDGLNFGFGAIEDSPVRMMFTPAFDAHYWDPQLLGL
ncbi:hypothetical protein FOPE_10239 [Fonsecaea pedrosoi]|nr:hypothetical protein FOPE_10239 [Fonsecaea pedrosoi]